MLDDEITKIQDVIGENSGLVIVMSTPVRTILNNAKDIQKYFERSHREDGNILYGRKVFTSEQELIR